MVGNKLIDEHTGPLRERGVVFGATEDRGTLRRCGRT